MRLRTIGLLAGLAVATPATAKLHSHHRDSTTLPVPGTDVLWYSDWSTGEITDGGKWEDNHPELANPLLTVIDDADFASGTALMHRYDGEQYQLIGAQGQWPAPAVGESICYAFVAKNDLPNGSGIYSEHGSQTNIGDISYYWQFYSPKQGMYDIGFGHRQLPDESFTALGALPAGTPVRFWWKVTRTGHTTANLDLLVSTRAGGRLVTPSDLKGDYGEGGYSLDGRLEDVDLGTVIDGFRSWHFGVAGIGGSRAASSGLKIGEFSVSNCD
jgi:hypothetical protein